MLIVLGFTIWLSIGILYNIYGLKNFWQGEMENPATDRINLFLTFMLCSMLFPLIMVINIYDRQYR